MMMALLASIGSRVGYLQGNCITKLPRDIVHNQIFNVGDTAHNYQVKEAQIVAEIFKGCKLSFGDSGADNRSYRVSFRQINKTLPGFKCDWNAQTGVQQLFDLFTQLTCLQTPFFCLEFTRLKQLEYLTRTQQIDKEFFWRQ